MPRLVHKPRPAASRVRLRHWRIDGRPYFSFYDLTRLLENFGSVEATRAALDQFRAKARAAGLPVIYTTPVSRADGAADAP